MDSSKTTKIIGILVLLLFVLEAVVTFYTQLIDLDKVRITGVYKVIFQVFILMLIKYRNLNKSQLYLILSLIFIFFISTVINPLFEHNFVWLLTKGSIYFFDRYLLIFLFVLMIYSRENQFNITQTCFRYIEKFLLINSVIILIGFLFSIDFFKSYINSGRFGFDGLFNKVNEASIIYMIYLIYLYYKTYIKKAQKKHLFILISISTLLLGTKSIFFFFTLLFVFHFLFVFHSKKNVKPFLLFIIAITLFFYKPILKYIFSFSAFWSSMRNDNILTLLLSQRDFLVLKNIDYINLNWTSINYIIGGGFYTNEFEISQMDGVDLFLFFGALGTLIYCLLLRKMFFRKNHIINSLLAIVLICGFLGGGLLTSAMAMVLLFLVSFKLNVEQ